MEWRAPAARALARSQPFNPRESVASAPWTSPTDAASPWASGSLDLHMSRGSPQQTATSSAITDTRVVAAQIMGDLRAGEMLDASFDRRTARSAARDRRG